MKKVSLIAFILTLCLSANAQSLKFGATAGVNINKAAGSLSTSGSRVGYRIGGVATYDFSANENSWYVGASLLLSQKGYKNATVFYEDEKSKNNTIDAHTDVTYLELPMVAGKHFRLGATSKLFVEAGPYLGIGLYGKHKMEVNGKEASSTSKVFDKDEGLKRVDAGLAIGIGIQAFNNWRFRLGYEHGLSNLINANSKEFPGTSKLTYRNRSLTVSATYIF